MDAIEENGVERFPTDVCYDDKWVSLIWRIDFAWAVENDAKKQKDYDVFNALEAMRNETFLKELKFGPEKVTDASIIGSY